MPGRRQLPLLALFLALAATVFVVAPSSTSGDGKAAVQLAKAEPNPVTPGDFTGYGFDQCLAPSQAAMDTWLRHSPFLAVGIYISGNSRACRSQPNLTTDWISTQLRNGWRLLPITLGPQASCSTRFPRYNDDPKINSSPGHKGKFGKARKMGRAEASKSVNAATALGIVPGSTLWYDLEAFDIKNHRCVESSLAFLSAWTNRLHKLDFVSGVYSSAGSGIKVLDQVRIDRPTAYTLPDMIWVARWDGKANTSTSYIADDGWRPGGRMKQYQGGHNETWGGVTINIDRNYLDLGKGSFAPTENHCGGVRVNFRTYPELQPPSKTSAPDPDRVRALQCLLKEQARYAGRVTGKFNAKTQAAVGVWQSQRGRDGSLTVTRRDWMALHAAGERPILKIGSAGPAVRRLQRTLNASDPNIRMKVSGRYTATTAIAVRNYRTSLGWKASQIVTKKLWKAMAKGR